MLGRISGVRQVSILCPHHFNIFIDNIFSFLTTCDIRNYAYDNTLYTDRDFHQVQEYLKKDFEMSGNWFCDNMKIIWSLILVNVKSWALEKPMKMRYLFTMKSDLKKYC